MTVNALVSFSLLFLRYFNKRDSTLFSFLTLFEKSLITKRNLPFITLVKAELNPRCRCKVELAKKGIMTTYIFLNFN